MKLDPALLGGNLDELGVCVDPPFQVFLWDVKKRFDLLFEAGCRKLIDEGLRIRAWRQHHVVRKGNLPIRSENEVAGPGDPELQHVTSGESLHVACYFLPHKTIRTRVPRSGAGQGTLPLRRTVTSSYATFPIGHC